METIKKIPFAKIHISNKERELVKEVLDSGWLTTAGKTLEFEKRFAEYVGAPYACAVNSCTADTRVDAAEAFDPELHLGDLVKYY